MVKSSEFKVFLAALGMLVIIEYYYKVSVINSLSDLILFLTFLAILWYSQETLEMRKQITEQNKLSICPFIKIYYDENEKVFKSKNIGNGIALNIEFSKLKSEKVYESLKIQEPSLLIVGEEKKILFGEYGIVDKEGERRIPRNSEDVEMILLGGKNHEVVIKFEDIRKNKYESRILLINGKIKSNYESKYLGFKEI